MKKLNTEYYHDKNYVKIYVTVNLTTKISPKFQMWAHMFISIKCYHARKLNAKNSGNHQTKTKRTKISVQPTKPVPL